VIEQTAQAVYRPVLGSVPDGRRSRLPLFDPLFCGYLAPMLGSLVAAVPAVYNAIALRRVAPALVALAIGIGGRDGFGFLLVSLVESGVKNIALVVLAGRVFHAVLGILIGASQWPYVRGHRILGGKTLPLLYGVLAAVALTALLPGKLTLALLGLVLP
jgi:hypothetical protein